MCHPERKPQTEVEGSESLPLEGKVGPKDPDEVMCCYYFTSSVSCADSFPSRGSLRLRIFFSVKQRVGYILIFVDY